MIFFVFNCCYKAKFNYKIW